MLIPSTKHLESDTENTSKWLYILLVVTCNICLLSPEHQDIPINPNAEGILTCVAWTVQTVNL